MKHLAKYATMLFMVLAMGLTFTSCGSDDDGGDDSVVSITNNSGYDLPRFTVVFLNAQYEELTRRDFGTLSPGLTIDAPIPTAASQFYMATYLGGEWYFSAYYSIAYKNMKLTRDEVGNWSTN